MTRKIRRTRNKSTRRGVRDRRTNRKVRVSNRKVRVSNRKVKKTNRKQRRTNRKVRRTNRKVRRTNRRSIPQIGGAVIAAKIGDKLKYLNEYEGDVTIVDNENDKITIELKGDSIVKWENRGNKSGPITKPFSDFYKKGPEEEYIPVVKRESKWFKDAQMSSEQEALKEYRKKNLEEVVGASDYLQQLSGDVEVKSKEVQSQEDKIKTLQESSLKSNLDILDDLLGKMWSKSCDNSEQDDSLKRIIDSIKEDMDRSKEQLQDLETELTDIVDIVSKIEISRQLAEEYNLNVEVLTKKSKDGVFKRYIEQLEQLKVEDLPSLSDIQRAIEGLEKIEGIYEQADVKKQEGPDKFKEYFNQQNAEVIRRLEEEQDKLVSIVKLTRKASDNRKERAKRNIRLALDRDIGYQASANIKSSKKQEFDTGLLVSEEEKKIKTLEKDIKALNKVIEKLVKQESSDNSKLEKLKSDYENARAPGGWNGKPAPTINAEKDEQEVVIQGIQDQIKSKVAEFFGKQQELTTAQVELSKNKISKLTSTLETNNLEMDKLSNEKGNVLESEFLKQDEKEKSISGIETKMKKLESSNQNIQSELDKNKAVQVAREVNLEKITETNESLQLLPYNELIKKYNENKTGKSIKSSVYGVESQENEPAAEDDPGQEDAREAESAEEENVDGGLPADEESTSSEELIRQANELYETAKELTDLNLLTNSVVSIVKKSKGLDPGQEEKLNNLMEDVEFQKRLRGYLRSEEYNELTDNTQKKKAIIVFVKGKIDESQAGGAAVQSVAEGSSVAANPSVTADTSVAAVQSVAEGSSVAASPPPEEGNNIKVNDLTKMLEKIEKSNIEGKEEIIDKYKVVIGDAIIMEGLKTIETMIN